MNDWIYILIFMVIVAILVTIVFVLISAGAYTIGNDDWTTLEYKPTEEEKARAREIMQALIEKRKKKNEDTTFD